MNDGIMRGKQFAQDFDRIDDVKPNDKFLVQDSEDGVVKYASPSQINAKFDKLVTDVEIAVESATAAVEAAENALAAKGAAEAAQEAAEQAEQGAAAAVAAAVEQYAEDVEQIRAEVAGAAALANQEATNAATKAALAQTKADLAETKAGLANTAAALANGEATNAATQAAAAEAAAARVDEAITAANEAAEYANEKGEWADTQGGIANAAAANANTKAQLADDKATLAHSMATEAWNATEAAQAATAQAAIDHATATADHSTAAADHTLAGQDHTTAAADHSTATTDHTNAASDHTRAGQDHTTAAADHTTASADHTASVSATAAATAAATTASEAAEAADEAREAIQDDLAAKANKDGYYDTLGAGYAKNLLGTGASVPAEFTFRPSGGTADIADGIATLKAIKGKTLVWNQLVQNGNFADGSTNWSPRSGSVSVDNGVLTFTSTVDTATEALRQRLNVSCKEGHKYLFSFDFMPLDKAQGCQYSLFASGLGTDCGYKSPVKQDGEINKWQAVSDIVTTGASDNIYVYISVAALTRDERISFRNISLIDLTQMFGAGNEPSSVEDFKALFPLDYYAYNAGQLLSFAGTGIKTIGFNAYKHSAAAAEVIGGMQYQITGTYTALTLDGEAVTPDASGIFTPTKTGTLAVTGGDNTTTCIHLVHSGTRNGEYEPYEEHLLTLPITTMTGKLNGEGSSVTIFPDGMRSAGSVHDELVRDASGNFVKAIVATGTRTYQEGDENDSTLVTDGTNTVYPLTTPQEFILDEPIPTAYQVADWGTEQLLPVNDDEPTTAPINADIIYGPNVQDAVRRLPMMYLSIADYKTGIANLASALGTSLGKTIAVAWGGDNGSVPTFTITDNAE